MNGNFKKIAAYHRLGRNLPNNIRKINVKVYCEWFILVN